MERRTLTSGLLEDQVAWLAERLRSGEITRDHVGFAAYLGSEAARRVWDPGEPSLGGPSPVQEVQDLKGFRQLLGEERAVVVVHHEWSGPSVLSRQRFDGIARLLSHLAPVRGIRCYSLRPSQFDEPGQAEIVRWTAERGQGCLPPDWILTQGNGEVLCLTERGLQGPLRLYDRNERDLIEDLASRLDLLL